MSSTPDAAKKESPEHCLAKALTKWGQVG